MYESFYGLTERPFSIQPDPDFLYLSNRHSMAYAMLQYGITNHAGFTVICGDVGCGKTTLVRHVLNNITDDVTVGIVYNTHKNVDDLLGWIMLAFGQSYDGLSDIALFDAFQQYLISSYIEGQRLVLIIDEAQNLNPSSLESLRMLSNINVDKDQMLQVILVGQPELRELLRRPDMTQFFQRVAVDFYIPPLQTPEVIKYIKHRMEVAGRKRALFTKEAMEKIAIASKGVPRSINLLCDMVLVYGFSANSKKLDVKLVDSVLADRADYGVLGPPS
jgi:type II secretory pathway predicted ATPase ExeA